MKDIEAFWLIMGCLVSFLTGSLITAIYFKLW